MNDTRTSKCCGQDLTRAVPGEGPWVCMNCGKPEFDSLREKIAWEKAERAARYAAFEALMIEAMAAGQAAHQAAATTTMVVEEHENQFDDSSPVVESYVVPGGACGFAWVVVRPGNSSFARWLVKTGRARAAYKGGVMIWINTADQSYERKVEYARAVAGVLGASPLTEGLDIYVGSRVD